MLLIAILAVYSGWLTLERVKSIGFSQGAQAGYQQGLNEGYRQGRDSICMIKPI